MASAFVPPPPEDDFLLLSSQQNDFGLGCGNSLGQSTGVSKLYSFGGDGFLDTKTQDEGSDVFMGHYGVDMIQRVPETPALRAAQHRTPQTASCRLDFSFDTPSVPSGRSHISLRSVTEIPERYRSVFKNYTHFNLVQSRVFDDVMYTDSPMVASAPTGSGKTVIFELAIIRLLMQIGDKMASAKVVYVAPIKALCSERYEDWQAKFGPLGLRCCELTGDSKLDDYFELQNAQIVMTTPEKWDSMTRKWRDHKSLVQLVRLFLIDEVHQLNDESRGATMEAIVSRMKTVRTSISWEEGTRTSQSTSMDVLRFIAVSATIPNISDVASWLGTEELPALEYSIDESHRPVRLRRVVLGYPNSNSEFKFDLSLNYRVSGVIQCYSEQKPSLVFCATRKGTQQAANVLVKDARFVMNGEHKQRLQKAGNSLRDSKLRELVVFGVGYHHAGMDTSDRKIMEAMFTCGDLPVLFATSTLAMGVNLPAHLVIIKSTLHYVGGMFTEYSESQILQMIGRAGRPQFDTTATAVIMTRNSTKSKYEALLGGTQLIESNLHRNLIEHLNAEIVLHTITDVSIALEWLRSTFLYIRIKQNPKHYGIPQEQERMEEKLHELCLKDLNLLEANSLLRMDDGFTLQPSETGRLMARYCVAFESMKRFLSLKGSEGLSELVDELSRCKEFEDVHLRVNEKRVLNTLNKDKNRPTIRFPMNGKMKSADMKVNCLIQASLGCLPIQEFALNQDSQKIFRAATRLSRCLMELQQLGSNFNLLLNAVILHKCVQARLWENSKHVAKQLDKIGLTLSTTLVNAGLTTFDKIRDTNPRELELIMNRHPPFGNQICETVSKLPRYSVLVEQSSNLQSHQAALTVTVVLVNHALLKEAGSTASPSHTCMLFIGDADNHVVCKQRITDSQLMGSGRFSRRITVQRVATSPELKVHLISLDYVGLDVEEVYTPRYTGTFMKSQAPGKMRMGREDRGQDITEFEERRDIGVQSGVRKTCNHRCINKQVCGHECCKSGIAVKENPNSTTEKSRRSQSTPVVVPSPQTRPAKRGRDKLGNYLSELRERASCIPETPALKRLKPSGKDYFSPQGSSLDYGSPALTSRFSYTPPAKLMPSASKTKNNNLSNTRQNGSNGGPMYQRSQKFPDKPNDNSPPSIYDDFGDDFFDDSAFDDSDIDLPPFPNNGSAANRTSATKPSLPTPSFFKSKADTSNHAWTNPLYDEIDDFEDAQYPPAVYPQPSLPHASAQYPPAVYPQHSLPHTSAQYPPRPAVYPRPSLPHSSAQYPPAVHRQPSLPHTSAQYPPSPAMYPQPSLPHASAQNKPKQIPPMKQAPPITPFKVPTKKPPVIPGPSLPRKRSSQVQQILEESTPSKDKFTPNRVTYRKTSTFQSQPSPFARQNQAPASQGKANPPVNSHPPAGQGMSHPPAGQGMSHPPAGQGMSHPPANQGMSHPSAGQEQLQLYAPALQTRPSWTMTTAATTSDNPPPPKGTSKGNSTKRQPPPSAGGGGCSFFTAGPVNPSEEDEGDVFGSVFAGIF